MPMPFEYQNASRQFEQFMIDARDFAGLATTNMSWNMVVGVLNAFRSRLTIPQSLLFADALPPVLRALYVEHWNVDQPLREFDTPEKMLDEIRSVRRQHNFAPEHAISAVAAALKKNMDPEVYQRMISRLPLQAQGYWAVDYKLKCEPALIVKADGS